MNDGAIINFGEFDFGEGGARSICVRAAVHPTQANGSIDVWCGEKGKETAIGRIILKSTGGWDKYEDFSLSLNEPLKGRHRLIFVVNGFGACNLAGWKYFE